MVGLPRHGVGAKLEGSKHTHTHTQMQSVHFQGCHYCQTLRCSNDYKIKKYIYSLLKEWTCVNVIAVLSSCISLQSSSRDLSEGRRYQRQRGKPESESLPPGDTVYRISSLHYHPSHIPYGVYRQGILLKENKISFLPLLLGNFTLKYKPALDPDPEGFQGSLL